MEKSLNHPPHCYLDCTYYFITSKTLEDDLFDSDFKKKFIFSSIKRALTKYNYTCQSWVILDNHYQLVIKSNKGKDLGKFVRYINGRSANLLLHDSPHLVEERGIPFNGRLARILNPDFHQQDGENQGEGVSAYYNKVWYQYWDTPLESIEEIWGYINYNHLNPIKHGCIDNILDLPKYKWSSYNAYLEKFGLEWMKECFERYPINVCIDEK